MRANNFNLLFFGSDLFSVRILKYLSHKRICPIQVVTKPGTLLDKFSSANKFKRHSWPLKICQENEFNLGLVASFGHLIDEKTIKSFKYGLFNVHPSLLPRYRGSTPIQAAVFNGDQETGCTIMKIPPIAKFDIGEIILQERVAIKNREYAQDLADRLADLGAMMAEKFILDYDHCIDNARPQGEEGRSYAKKLKPEQGLVKFRENGAKIIDRQVRAYAGAIELFTFCLNGLRVRLEDVKDPKEIEAYDLDRLAAMLYNSKNVINSSNGNGSIPAGTMFLHKTRHLMGIKCADGQWISFDHVTPESKPKMSSLDFYNGFLSKVDLKDAITDY